jgi:hypothetical protein
MLRLSYIIWIGIIILTSCNKPITCLKYENPGKKILFLHHSTGNNVWFGDINPNQRLYLKNSTCLVPRLMKEYNDQKGIEISIEERAFPKGDPYPWENYPFDYFNIWVKNSGDSLYHEEPTLEMLTKEFDIIIFKHCFPVSSIQEDDQNPDINSNKKTLANYKLQYNALKEKLKEFPDTRFIVWTGAALVEKATTTEEAIRAREFFAWVTTEWDETDDNIFIFDFRQIETEGGLYLKPGFAAGSSDSHPNKKLSTKAADLFVKKIVEVIESTL